MQQEFKLVVGTKPLELRPYQQEMVNQLRAAFASGKKRLVMQMPTGGGKTAVFTDITRRVTERGGKVMIVTDRKELHQQGGNALARLGVGYRELSAKTTKLDDSPVTMAMVETLKRRLIRPDYAAFVKRFKLIIIDECHKNTFNRLFEALDEEQLVIGATATPIRTGKMRALKADYDGIVNGPEIIDLVEQGYLCPEKAYGVSVDLSDVRITAGEYNEGDMGKVYGNRKLFDGVIENWKEFALGKKTLVFCATVENSINLAKEFIEAGFRAAHIDAETPEKERNAILRDFAEGKYHVLSNCGILNTGYDCASIECIILYRATMSLPLYLQMCGRGSRTYFGKAHFIILDFGQNVQRHGFWRNPRKWSLDIKVKKKSKKVGEMVMAVCPSCKALLPARARKCSFCGWEKEMEADEKMVIKLKEMTPSEIMRFSETASVEELETIRRAREWKIGFVLHRFKSMKDFVDYEALKGYKRGWAMTNGNRYLGIESGWDKWYGSRAQDAKEAGYESARERFGDDEAVLGVVRDLSTTNVFD